MSFLLGGSSGGGGTTAEQIQDDVATALTDSSTIDFTYNDAGNTITAAVIPGGIDHGALADLLADDHTQYFQVTGRNNENLTFSGTGRILNSAGSATLPSFSFSGDPNTGIYNQAADVLGFVTNAVERWRIDANGNFISPLDNSYNIGANGGNRPANIYVAGLVAVGDGSAASPSLTFDSDEDTGIYRSAVNELSFSQGGVARWRMDAAGSFFVPGVPGDLMPVGGVLAFRGNNLLGDASAATPSYTFENDQNTGFFRPGTDRIGVSTGGTSRWEFIANGDLASQVAGGGLRIKEGSNAKMGVATLVGGTVTVSNTNITTSTRIFLTHQNSSGTPGFVIVSARNAGTDFTITSSSGTDTSDIAWLLIEPSA